MQLKNLRLEAKNSAEVRQAPLVSTKSGYRPRKPGLGGPALTGFGPPVAAERTKTTVIGGLVLLTIAALVFMFTFVADRALTFDAASHSALAIATPRPSGLAAATPQAMSDTDVLPLPALDPATWRSGPASVEPQTERSFVASPQEEEAEVAPIAAEPSVGPVAEATPTAPPATPDKLDPALLVNHGNAYLARSDVVAARLLYRRAADDGSAVGAAALAASFDPVFLEHNTIRGARADPAAALHWYGVAAKMGDPAAERHAAALIERLRSVASRGDMEARSVLDRAQR